MNLSPRHGPAAAFIPHHTRIQATTLHTQNDPLLIPTLFIPYPKYSVAYSPLSSYLALVRDTRSASIKAGKRRLSTPADRLWTHTSFGARGNSWLSSFFLP